MRTKTAPMGWNSWDCYGTAANEKIVRKNAEFMAKHLKKYGWEYIVVDAQWFEPLADKHEYNPFADMCMDEYSRLIPAPNKYPSSADGKGFAPLAEYVHSLGLKFGVHIMRGIPRQAVHRNSRILGSDRTAREIAKTASICKWNTDMYGVDPEKEGAKEYYESLFAQFAEWGVDFIKCDDICRELPHEEAELIMLSEALHSCGRDMILSLSPGPALTEKAELYKQVCDMWRISDDFWDNWKDLYNMFGYCEKWSAHCGAGRWPDADMLPVGALTQDYHPDNRTRFTHEEQRTMMTLWSIFRSPLMIGSELTKMDDFTMELLTNEGILEMHRNARHSHQVFRRNICGTEIILWTAVSSGGGQYAAVFNTGDSDASITIPLAELEIYAPVRFTELWSNTSGSADEMLSAELKAHDAAAFLIG